jgi:hypothetical protein
LVPHDEVLATASELEPGLADGAAEPEVGPAAALRVPGLLPQPARTPPNAMTAAAAPASSERRPEYLFTCSAFP